MSSDSSLSREHSPLLADVNKTDKRVIKGTDKLDKHVDYDGLYDWTSDRSSSTEHLYDLPHGHSGSTRHRRRVHSATNMGFSKRLLNELWAFKKTILFVLIPLLASPLLIVIGDGVSTSHYLV